jgi:hypothetical protein
MAQQQTDEEMLIRKKIMGYRDVTVNVYLIAIADFEQTIVILSQYCVQIKSVNLCIVVTV